MEIDAMYQYEQYHYEGFYKKHDYEYEIEYFFEYPFENTIPCRINIFQKKKEDGHFCSSSHVFQVRITDEVTLSDVTFIKDGLSGDEKNEIYEIPSERIRQINTFKRKFLNVKDRYPNVTTAALVHVLGYIDLMEKYGMDVKLFCEDDLNMKENEPYIGISGFKNSISFDVYLNLFTLEAELEVQVGVGFPYEIVDFVENLTPSEIEKRLKCCSFYDWDVSIFGTVKYYYSKKDKDDNDKKDS